MGELVSVGEIMGEVLKVYNDPSYYEKRKREIFASVNERTERVSNGMIYCRKCGGEKVADFPERNFVVKCSCKCDVDAWERERNRMNRPMHAREIRAGDWNPFD